MNNMTFDARKLNRRGVAIVMVAILIVVMLPIIFIFTNLSSSQKSQSMNFNSLLQIEQIAQSGINSGFSRLKSGHQRGYQNLSGEVSGADTFDLNLTPTGYGFFAQDIYLMLSKSTEDKHNSIIVTDAEQFQREKGANSVLVITHDYWTTQEPYELGVVADVLSMRNTRGRDQLRYLDVKKFEMENTDSSYRSAMKSVGDNYPNELKDIWEKVVDNLVKDKISK